jgi:uncharacterized membrane protein YkvA (DUF1232 family)
MTIVSFFARARLLFDLPRMGMLLVRLFRDGRVPAWLKLGGVAAAVMIVSPLDIFSDIPLLGPIDDLALLLVLAQTFVGMCPAGVVAELNGSGRVAPTAPTVRVVKNITPQKP